MHLKVIGQQECHALHSIAPSLFASLYYIVNCIKVSIHNVYRMLLIEVSTLQLLYCQLCTDPWNWFIFSSVCNKSTCYWESTTWIEINILAAGQATAVNEASKSHTFYYLSITAVHVIPEYIPYLIDTFHMTHKIMKMAYKWKSNNSTFGINPSRRLSRTPNRFTLWTPHSAACLQTYKQW